ncbi:MAG: methyl viologen-reducing hydrogenase [Deltaproteobacteria bacterium]|nr:methyl viologen-reducing hydrogenase [Deltaproteobacteria bacterium]
MKARVSTEWLSGCAGCHVAVVDLHEKLLNLVEDVEFVRAPVLMDEKGYPEADVGLVEGAVRSHHDREALLRMRDSVKTLVAFGSCAVYGGPSGLGWLHEREAVLDRAYRRGPTNAGGQLPDADAVPLEDSVVPIDEIVPVDFYLPGCPPHPYYIAAGLRTLLGASAPPLTAATVCSDCTRKMRKRPGQLLQKGAVTADDPESCFLSQGVVCLGSVTLNRCLAPCPQKGAICTGCAGPSMDVLAEPHLDMRGLVAKRMNLLCGIDPKDVKAYFERDAKTFYAYAVASPVIYRKPTVEMLEWTAAGQSA